VSPFQKLPELKHSKGIRKKSRKLKGTPPKPIGGAVGRALDDTVQGRRERCTSGIGGSLPERMTRFALVKLGVPFQEQQSFRGGNSVFAVLDFILYIGTQPVALRIQSYWHLELERVAWDMVQMSRLHARGMRVVDIDELELYAAADINCSAVIRMVRNAIFS